MTGTEGTGLTGELPLRIATAMPPEFFTVGHSNRTLEEFTALLRGAEIRLIADIRRIPMSRAHPHFNGDSLREALSAIDISYEHMSALGGRRGTTPGVPKEVNAFWTNRSFHNYADYALSDPFRVALDHLLEQGHTQRCAIMCSEAVWWRCHRRIVTDYLLAGGESVLHIMGPSSIQPARQTAGAIVRSAGRIVYPAAGANT